MRVRSWEEAGLDGRRVAAFCAAVGGALFLTVGLAGAAAGLGTVSLALGALAAAGACYLVATAPRRTSAVAGFEQTLEAPSLAASSNIYLKSTASRTRALLLLRGEERMLSSFLADVRRHVLLGYDAPSAVEAAGPEGRLFSESVRTVVGSTVGVDRARVEEGSDELDAILNSSGLDDETKLPLLMAVAFFLPIMLMLFAAMTKATGGAEAAALLAIEVVVLDIALGFSRTSAPWRARGGGGRK